MLALHFRSWSQKEEGETLIWEVGSGSQLFAEGERDLASMCVHSGVYVCCGVIAGLGCPRQAPCQVGDEPSWLACWAHLHDYTCLFKRLVSQMQ